MITSSWEDLAAQFSRLAAGEQGRTAPLSNARQLRSMEHVLRAFGTYQRGGPGKPDPGNPGWWPLDTSYLPTSGIGYWIPGTETGEQILQPVGPSTPKCAPGSYCLLTPAHGHWTYDGHEVSENFRARVRLCVTKAGRALPDRPQDVDPEDFWLHRLFLDLKAKNSNMLVAVNESGGVIVSVCIASATFCEELARSEPAQGDADGAENHRRKTNRERVDDYIAEVLRKTGKQIGRKEIWVAAGYGDDTELQRWQRNDLKHPNRTADDKFNRVLTEKPHLRKA